MKTYQKIAICLMAAIVVALGIFVLPLDAEAATSGDYTYTVSNGKVKITDYSGAGGDITIPSTLGGYPVTTIGEDAFSYCSSLTSATIGNSVTTIGNYAFYSCDSLTSITSPDSVTTIGSSAFGGRSSLTGIWVDADNTNYCSDDQGVLFNKNKTVLIQAPGGIIGSYTIPDSVTTIGQQAFECCPALTSVTIGNGVTTIGNYAFYDCANLVTVYYNGTLAQWKTVKIGNNNTSLTNANCYFKNEYYNSC